MAEENIAQLEGNNPNDETLPNIDSTQKKINSNGFSSTPTCFQIIPVVYAIIANNLTHISIQLFLMTETRTLRISVHVLLVVLLLFLIFSWYQATSINPTDKIQFEHRLKAAAGLELEHKNFKFFCKSCRTYVGRNAYHCRQCNRCVNLFDHHCKWLNNCIGAKNYYEFLSLVFFNLLISAIQVFIAVCLLIRVLEGQTNASWKFYLLQIGLFSGLGPLCYSMFLIIMHCYLICAKKSTFDLIRQSRRSIRIHTSQTKKSYALNNESSRCTPRLSQQSSQCNQINMLNTKGQTHLVSEQILDTAEDREPSLQIDQTHPNITVHKRLITFTN